MEKNETLGRQNQTVCLSPFPTSFPLLSSETPSFPSNMSRAELCSAMLKSLAEQETSSIPAAATAATAATATASYTVTGFIRQNPWGKLDEQLAVVEKHKKVHCPWGHTTQDVEQYTANPGGFRKKYAKHFTRFPTGALLLIAEAKKDTALLVRLTSAPRTGVLSHYILIRRPRTCGHTLTKPGRGCAEGCAACEDSVVKIYTRESVTKEALLQYMMEGCVPEPFNTIYRDMEIVGHVRLRGEGTEAVRHYCDYQASLKKTGITLPATLVTTA